MRNLLLQAGLAALSGFAMTLSHPPYGIWPLAWMALVPLFVVLRGTGPLRGGIFAFLCGLSFYYTHMTWFIHIEGMTLARHLLAGAMCAWVLIPFGMAASMLYSAFPRLAPVAVPFAWVLAEYLHTHSGFLSLAWGLLGYSQYRVLPVAGLASFYGIFGVSALIALTNSLLADLLTAALNRRRRLSEFPRTRKPSSDLKSRLFYSVLGLMVLPVLLTGPWKNLPETSSRIRVAVVQGKGEDTFTGQDRIIRAFERYRDITLEADRSHPDLIVWPETAIPGRIPYDGGLVKLLGDMARQAGAYLLVGAAGYDKFSPSARMHGRFANSAFLFGPDGRLAGRYDKMKLVPFNEYLPLRGKFPWPGWITGSNWKDSIPGEKLNLLFLRNIPFGVPICWENYFPEHFREFVLAGARFMVSMNNESFIADPAAHEQMLAINVYRAIENRVPVIRPTPTGITAIIDPRGKVLETVKNSEGKEVNITGYVVGDLELGQPGTFYTRHGDWLVIPMALLTLPFILAAVVNRVMAGRRKA